MNQLIVVKVSKRSAFEDIVRSRSAIAGPRSPTIARSSDSTSRPLLAFGFGLLRYFLACLSVSYDLANECLPYFSMSHFVFKRQAPNRVQFPTFIDTNSFHSDTENYWHKISTPPCHSFKLPMMQSTDPNGERQSLSAGLLKPFTLLQDRRS